MTFEATVHVSLALNTPINAYVFRCIERPWNVSGMLQNNVILFLLNEI